MCRDFASTLNAEQVDDHSSPDLTNIPFGPPIALLRDFRETRTEWQHTGREYDPIDRGILSSRECEAAIKL